MSQSYKYLSFLMHPDRASTDSEATEKFQIIAQIYAVLSDPEKRQMYDLEKFVIIASDEIYAKARDLYAGN